MYEKIGKKLNIINFFFECLNLIPCYLSVVLPIALKGNDSINS